MAQKTCPSCQNKCGPRQKICPNCKFEFPLKDDKEKDEDDDRDDELDDGPSPERLCIKCKIAFEPKIIKRTPSGDIRYIWSYDNYCSVLCLEESEKIMFNFIYNLTNSNSSIISDEVKNLVTLQAYKYRQESDDINYTSFRLVSRQKLPPSKEEWEDFTGRPTPKKQTESVTKPVQQQEDTIPISEDMPLDDFIDAIADIPTGPKLINTSSDQKLDRYHKQCPTCKNIMGKKKYICDKCGHNFKITE